MNRNSWLSIFLGLILILPAAAGAQSAGPAVSEPAASEQKSLSDVAQQLNNPVADILIDWKADQDNRFTVPVGLGIGKLVMIGPLPVKFTLEADYMVIHPDDFGQHWGIRFQVIPVLPALFKDTLF